MDKKESGISRIENAHVESYKTFLVEKYRSPSKGGNSSALHSHVLTIDGDSYSFLAVGSKKWVYSNDKVSFDYELKGKYRNIIKNSISVVDKNGNPQTRGDRRFKSKLRSSTQRTPVSRREDR